MFSSSVGMPRARRASMVISMSRCRLAFHSMGGPERRRAAPDFELTVIECGSASSICASAAWADVRLLKC